MRHVRGALHRPRPPRASKARGLAGAPEVQPILRKLALGILVSAAFLGSVEITLRILPLDAFRHSEGPLPLWLVNEPFMLRQLLDVKKHRGVWARQLEAYEPDRELFWRLRPGADVTAEDFFEPPALWERTRWRFWTSEDGFRTAPLEPWQVALERGSAGRPGADGTSVRLVALGDSTTFGWGVEADEAFPAVLERLWGAGSATGSLEDRPALECRNLGVPGYSTVQGLRLAERWLPRLDPDVVTIGFGSNDSAAAPESESDATRAARRDGLAGSLSYAFEQLRLYQLLRHQLRPVRATGEAGPRTEAPVPRVDAPSYAENLRAADALCRAHEADLVVLFLCGPPAYREAARSAAAELRRPFVDAQEIFARAEDEGSADAGASADGADPELARHVTAVRELYEGVDGRPADLGSFVSPDRCHPNPGGHYLVARELVRIVESLAAERIPRRHGEVPAGEGRGGAERRRGIR